MAPTAKKPKNTRSVIKVQSEKNRSDKQEPVKLQPRASHVIYLVE